MITIKGITLMVGVKEMDNSSVQQMIAPFCIEGEETLASYKSLSAYMVFTSKRIIFATPKLFSKKKTVKHSTYSNIKSFEATTTGRKEKNCDMTINFSDIGEALIFFKDTDISKIFRLISEHTLK